MDVLRVAKLGKQTGGFGKLTHLQSGRVSVLANTVHFSQATEMANSVQARFDVSKNFHKFDSVAAETLAHKIINVIYSPINERLESNSSSIPEHEREEREKSLVHLKNKFLLITQKSISHPTAYNNEINHKIEYRHLIHHISFNPSTMYLNIITQSNANLNMSELAKIRDLLHNN